MIRLGQLRRGQPDMVGGHGTLAFAFIPRSESSGSVYCHCIIGSPIATAEQRHGPVSTNYSRPVLRAVRGQLDEQFDNVARFPSYEIITGNFNRGE
jgi:hypothetical protein